MWRAAPKPRKREEKTTVTQKWSQHFGHFKRTGELPSIDLARLVKDGKPSSASDKIWGKFVRRISVLHETYQSWREQLQGKCPANQAVNPTREVLEDLRRCIVNEEGKLRDRFLTALEI